MKKIGIIGSGIPSLFAAYFLKEKGYEVVVTEGEKRGGGLYKFLETKYGKYDLGCRFVALTGNNKVDEFFEKICQPIDGWVKFRGNKSDISGCLFNNTFQFDSSIIDLSLIEKKLKDKFERSVIKHHQQQRDLLPKKDISLFKYWENRFGKLITKNLINVIFEKKFGLDSKQISSSCINIFPIRRLIFSKETTDILKKMKNGNKIIASRPHKELPESLFINNVGLYSKEAGIGVSIEQAIKKLKAMGIKFYFNKKISNICTQKKYLTLSTNEIKINEKLDFILWNSPEKLLKYCLDKEKNKSELFAKNYFLANFFFEDAEAPKDIYYAYDFTCNSLEDKIDLYRVNYYDNYSFNGINNRHCKLAIEFTSFDKSLPTKDKIINYLLTKGFLSGNPKTLHYSIVGPAPLPLTQINKEKNFYDKRILHGFDIKIGENTLTQKLLNTHDLISEIN